MARKFRIALVVSASIVVLLLAVVCAAYWAAGQVRPFYRHAMQIDPQALQLGSRELESRAAALVSDSRRAGQWQAVFTDQQINGWLAVQLAENYADRLPEEINQPRVAITPEAVTLGFSTHRGGVETVVSVDASLMLTESGAIGLRLLSVRAGALPMPAMQIADQLAAACCQWSVPVRWTQLESDPVALIEMRQVAEPNQPQVYLDSIELQEGAIFVAGHTTAAESKEKFADREQLGAPSGSGIGDYELRLSSALGGPLLEVSRHAEVGDAATGRQPPAVTPSAPR